MAAEIITGSISLYIYESMWPGQDPTRDPWICSQTCICSQTRYQLRYGEWSSDRMVVASFCYLSDIFSTVWGFELVWKPPLKLPVLFARCKALVSLATAKRVMFIWLYVPVNSYGQVGMVSSPNPTFSWTSLTGACLHASETWPLTKMNLQCHD